MACFLAPAAVAIAAESIKKKVSAKYHLEWLTRMLWGGVLMLMVDHIATGEVIFFPPFLTALKDPADIPVMLREIVTVGGAMTVAVIIVWAIMVLIANKRKKGQENRLDENKIVLG